MAAHGPYNKVTGVVHLYFGTIILNPGKNEAVGPLIQLNYPPRTLLRTIWSNFGHSNSILQTGFYFSLNKPSFQDPRFDYLEGTNECWSHIEGRGGGAAEKRGGGIVTYRRNE